MASHCKYAGRTWVLIVVLALGVTACGEDSAGGGSVGSPESRPAPQAGEVICGRPFQPPASSGLRLVGRFPESVRTGQQMVSGTVEVTSEKAVRGVAASRADAFLVREGQIVTTPLAQDAVGARWVLAAGETKRVPATASLMSCERSGEPLAPGDYDLYAQFVLTPDDGAPTTAHGGPWPLRVR